MDPIYVPILATLGGAIVGSISSLGAIWLQAKIHARREKLRLVCELAIADHKAALEVGKLHASVGTPTELAPIALFVTYHEAIVRALEKGKIDSTQLKHIRVSNSKLWEGAK